MNRRLFLGFVGAASLAGAASAETAHDHVFENIDGGEIWLSDFAGRPVLVVNTASKCGFTPQYDGLQALYDAYRNRGLVVLAVPSDDFGGQEFDTEAEVKEFCEVNFNLDLPMTTITRVKGRDAHPFFRFASARLGAPRWNFHKYLVGPDGQLLESWSYMTGPRSPRISRRIEPLLLSN